MQYYWFHLLFFFCEVLIKKYVFCLKRMSYNYWNATEGVIQRPCISNYQNYIIAKSCFSNTQTKQSIELKNVLVPCSVIWSLNLTKLITLYFWNEMISQGIITNGLQWSQDYLLPDHLFVNVHARFMFLYWNSQCTHTQAWWCRLSTSLLILGFASLQHTVDHASL